MKTENPHVRGSMPPLATIFKPLFLGLFPIQGWKQKNKVTQIGVTSVLLDGWSDLRDQYYWGSERAKTGVGAQGVFHSRVPAPVALFSPVKSNTYSVLVHRQRHQSVYCFVYS